MNRNLVHSGVKFLAVASVVLFVLYITPNMLLWGRPFPISKVDKLQDTVRVVTWQPDGLRLSDGRTVMPAGMIELPRESKTIEIATRECVEVAPDGRVFGLVKIWHWCGNDPVRNDLSKTDIAQLLAYHKEGKSSLKPHDYSDRGFVEMGGGSKRGWNMSARTRMRMCFKPEPKEVFDPSPRSLALAKN